MKLALEHGAFNHWSEGGRIEVSREAFWRLVDGYLWLIEGDGRVGGFALLVAKSSVDAMAVFVAAIAAGREVSIFPPSSPRQDAEAYLQQQREAVLKISPSSILLLEAEGDGIGEIDPRLGQLIVRLPRLSQDADLAGASTGDGRRRFQEALLGRQGPLFWQHSSGTTGIKKAVGVSGAALIGQFESYWPVVAAGLGGEPIRVASWLPLYHDMGLLTGLLLPLLGGSDIAFMDPFDWVDDPGRFLEMIQAERSSVAWMPNFAFRHFVRLEAAMPRCDLSSVKLWASCSEPCRYADALAFEAAFAGRGVPPGSVLGCYAMAETVFAVSHLAAGGQRALMVPRGLAPGRSVIDAGAYETCERAPQPPPGWQAVLSSGAPIPGVETALFLDGERLSQEGTHGEIGLRGAFVFDGYRGLGRTESGLRDDGFFLTGDLGTILDGRLYVLGRSKEVIIVNGKNIYAGDVEERVGEIVGVRPGRAAAFGVDNPLSGSEELVVIAEKDPSVDIPEAAIRAAISAAISDAFLVKPYDVRVLAGRWLVKSSSGKVSRDKNKSKYLRDFRPDLS